MKLLSSGNFLPVKKETTCAIIVAYYPPDQLKETVSCLCSQVSKIVIIDNTPNSELVQELATINSSVYALSMERNVGLASALNRGLHFASSLGVGWVSFFDQDSLPYHTYLFEMAKHINQIDSKESFGLCGCNYEDTVDNTVNKGYFEAEGLFKEVKTVITAGTLMPINTFTYLGEFKEKLFIDHIDHEYCLRARQHGLSVYLCTSILMKHSTGNISFHYLLKRKIVTSNHSPTRLYYSYRNLIFCIYKYFFSELKWCIDMLFIHLIMKNIYIFSFEKEKVPKVKMEIIGLIHGILKKYGKLKKV